MVSTLLSIVVLLAIVVYFEEIAQAVIDMFSVALTVVLAILYFIMHIVRLSVIVFIAIIMYVLRA